MEQRTVINLNPQHNFAGLAELPEAQLMFLMPRALWQHVLAYVPRFEAIELAGRFGAEPGEYEWEIIDGLQGLKWWRRDTIGQVAYVAALIAPHPETDPLEVFGLIDIASNTPWWLDAVENADQVQGRSEILSRQRGVALETMRVLVSIEDDYRPRKLITSESDENGVAWRVGDLAEVTRLKEAVIGLVNRARGTTLPA